MYKIAYRNIYTGKAYITVQAPNPMIAIAYAQYLLHRDNISVDDTSLETVKTVPAV